MDKSNKIIKLNQTKIFKLESKYPNTNLTYVLKVIKLFKLSKTS